MSGRGLALLTLGAALLGGSLMIRRSIVISGAEMSRQPAPSNAVPVATRRRLPPAQPQEVFGGSAPVATRAPRARTSATEAVRGPASGPVAGGAPVGSPEPSNTQGPRGDPSRVEAQAKFSADFARGSADAGDGTPPIIADRLEFDPDLAAVRLGPEAVLAYPDSGGINIEQGTVALWVRPEWAEPQPDAKTLIELNQGTWENRLDLQISPVYVRFMLTTQDGVEHAVGAGGRFGSGDWHHVAATWGDGALSVYIDGSLKSEASFMGSAVIPPGTPVYVGSSRKGALPGTLSLRGLNIFPTQLAPGDVAALAEQTLPPG